MDDIVAVQILYAKTDVNKYFPDEVLNEELSVLFFNIGTQVPMLAILHYYVYLCVDNESVIISHNEVTVKLSKQFRFN